MSLVDLAGADAREKGAVQWGGFELFFDEFVLVFSGEVYAKYKYTGRTRGKKQEVSFSFRKRPRKIGGLSPRHGCCFYPAELWKEDLDLAELNSFNVFERFFSVV